VTAWVSQEARPIGGGNCCRVGGGVNAQGCAGAAMVDGLVSAQHSAMAACDRADPASVAMHTSCCGIVPGAGEVLAAANFRSGVCDE